MEGILSSLDCFPEIVGGVEDHVHVLVGLPMFGWQEGYGVFTVSASQCETVKKYIAGQEEHHRTRSFHEEYVDFLKKSGVIFDPRYL